MKAIEKDSVICQRFASKLSVPVTLAHAKALRLAERALQVWGEAECGDGSDWHIERDEETGAPYRCYHGQGPDRPRVKIFDKEARALKTAETIAAHYNFTAYHQTDPRGCLLYVGPDLNDQNYSTAGVACCTD